MIGNHCSTVIKDILIANRIISRQSNDISAPSTVFSPLTNMKTMSKVVSSLKSYSVHFSWIRPLLSKISSCTPILNRRALASVTGLLCQQISALFLKWLRHWRSWPSVPSWIDSQIRPNSRRKCQSRVKDR